MRAVVIVPPSPVVSTDEAKDHLRVGGNDEDGAIDGMIAAAIGHLDGPDGWLGRAIGLQTLDAYSEGPDANGDLSLPYPPIVSVQNVEARCGGGAWSTVDPANYEVCGDRIQLSHSLAWPARQGLETFKIRYSAGYAELPAPIRSAILLMVGDLYANREISSSGMGAPSALLRPFRVWC